MCGGRATNSFRCLVNFVYCDARIAVAKLRLFSPIATGLIPVRGAFVMKISRASVLTRIRSRFKQTHVIREWILWEKSVSAPPLHAYSLVLFETKAWNRRRGGGRVLEVVEVGTVEAWLDLYTDSSRNVSSKIEPRHKGVTRFRPRVNVAIRGRKSGRLWFRSGIPAPLWTILCAKLCNKCYEIERGQRRPRIVRGRPTYYPYRAARDRVPLSPGLAEVSRSNWINIH